MAAKLFTIVKQIHTMLLIAAMFVSVVWFQAKLSTIVEANEARDVKEHAVFNESCGQLKIQQIYLTFISNKLETLDRKITTK